MISILIYFIFTYFFVCHLCLCFYIFIKKTFLAALHGFGDLSSLTRDRAFVPNSEVQSLNHPIAREVTTFFFSHEESEVKEVKGFAQGHRLRSKRTGI